MRRDSLFVWVLFFSLAGCSKSPDPITVSDFPTTQASPSEQAFEGLRSGQFQIEAALDSIEEALNAARAKSSDSIEIKQSLEEIATSIDSAGNNLAEEAAVQPNKGEPVSKVAARKKLLSDLVNDSLHDLRDARGIVDSLAEGNEAGPLEDIGVLIDVALDDLRGALEALGGKEEVEG